jgi:hypothetical protein
MGFATSGLSGLSNAGKPKHSFVIAVREQRRQNPEDVLGFQEHGRVGQLVVVSTYVPIWCFVASGGSDRRTKHCVVESSLAGRIVA